MTSSTSLRVCPPPPDRLPDLVPADRKVVLARMLAAAEARRCGIEPTPEEVKAMARWWRKEYGLLALSDFGLWLRFSGMELSAFWEVMHDFVALSKVLEHHAVAIDERMRDHLAIHTVRGFHACHANTETQGR
ncbi:hypothetical protein [Paraliomyxa miuraensis]|uniref:hypothetical protein n=1 Tax=Paraliomyxa miuraensis TaxID=376150 RepID=UPI00225A8EB7|nr:hypothetical protein [Paraliomyxa miuraensis]MCX4247478.1 hypothetical protein [Paraliomyxa miuraensis]